MTHQTNTLSLTESEELKHILTRSKNLFMRFGVKSITMSDIARELGISKKTIYKYVENKEGLIYAGMNKQIEDEKQVVGEIIKTAYDAIDEMIRISLYVNQQLQQFNPSLAFELQKYYPKCWALMDEYRMGWAAMVIHENIERGRREGVYRLDFNVEMAVRFYLAKMLAFLNPDLFPYPQFSPADVHISFVHFHLHSIASPKGLELFKKYTFK